MTVPTRTPTRHSRQLPVPAEPWRSRLRTALRQAAPALLLFLAARAAVLLVVLAASPHPAGTTLSLLGTHWDANQYLEIARNGYGPAPRLPLQTGDPAHYSNLAFFPLYPAAMAGLHAALPFLAWSAVGPLVATLASFAAAWGIFAALAPHFGPRVATCSVLLWGIAPNSLVENAGYSESLFTALAAWTLWALVRRRWLTAALLCVLAGLTRPTAAALIAVIGLLAAMEVYRAVRGRRTPADGPLWRPVLAAVLAPLGWLGYIGWTGLQMHNATAYFQIQAQWNSRFDYGATTLHDLGLMLNSTAQVNTYLPVTGAVLAAAVLLAAFALWRRHPPVLTVFCLVLLLVTLGDSAYFSSRPRFLLPAFPLLVPIASALNRMRGQSLAVIVLVAATVASGCYSAYSFYLSVSAP